MKKSSLWWAAGIGAFVMILLYTTVLSMPETPPRGVEHTAEAAAATCEGSVAENLGDARFPFPATPTYLGDAQYRLNGIVESWASGEAVRQNYECFVRYTDADRYRTDSLSVWQSH